MIGTRVAVGTDALLPDWLQRFPAVELRAAHQDAVQTLSEARRRRRIALDSHSRRQGDVLAGNDKLGAEIAAERRAVDDETGRAMVALAGVIDHVIDTVGETAMRGQLQRARRNAIWLRAESRELLG